MTTDRSASDRLLAWTGVDEPEAAPSKLRSMRRLVLITVACEAWLALGYVPYSSHAFAFGLVATALGACAVVGWRDRWARPALRFALAGGPQELPPGSER